jgi:hypothetical protein
MPAHAAPKEAAPGPESVSRLTVVVNSGNTKQRRLRVGDGDRIRWRFKESSGHVVGVQAFFVRSGMAPGDEVEIVPALTSSIADRKWQYVSPIFETNTMGEVVLIFSNADSWFTDKTVELEITRLGRAPPPGIAPPPDKPVVAPRATKVVVLGGTGHIGSYLCPRLAAELSMYTVVCVSRGSREPYAAVGSPPLTSAVVFGVDQGSWHVHVDLYPYLQR